MVVGWSGWDSYHSSLCLDVLFFLDEADLAEALLEDLCMVAIRSSGAVGGCGTLLGVESRRRPYLNNEVP